MTPFSSVFRIPFSVLLLSALPAAAAPARTAAEAFAEWAAAARPETGGLEINFDPADARHVRFVILASEKSQACLDELEVYGPESGDNLALASRGAVATASSLLKGHAAHAVEHLNDGLYGNRHSWIPASPGLEWAQIELPAPVRVSRVVVSRDRTGEFKDRAVKQAEVRVSTDGVEWRTVASIGGAKGLRFSPARLAFPAAELRERTWDGVIEYAFLRERDTWSRMAEDEELSPRVNDRPAVPGGPPYWGRLARLSPTERTLEQFGGMIDRLAAPGLDVAAERAELDSLRRRLASAPDGDAADRLYLDARTAKRRLFFRDPRLAPLERVLFAKRHPLKPTHNYSEHLDSIFVPGGGVHALRVPRDADGRLDPARAVVDTLFDGSEGIVRHPVADFDGQTVYFAYRPDRPEREGWQSYWHLMAVPVGGGAVRRLTDGPFHDFDPVPLPDGGLGFITTRCKSRFLCWRPQAYVLFRMESDGSGIRRLSFANLSEWDPAMMRDGRILWTRSEYQDKGADFGHTLWSIRPDGTQPELVFGNNTPYGYGHARQMPGTRELVCTLISHGDHQGPIALIDPARGFYSTAAITSITPDTRPQYQMGRSYVETFRDPEPVSEDHVLVSHNPGRTDHWSLYVIDRYGNRELLYLDGAISSKKPSLLQLRPRPPVLFGAFDETLAVQGLGQFFVQDVYEGLDGAIERGRAKYVQVSQEIPPELEALACGQYASDHQPFQDHYATPVHRVRGPPRSYTTPTDNALGRHAFKRGSAERADDGRIVVTENGGWPSYTAKAVLGVARVADDGSAAFTAPAGRVIYFHLLDENFNELQRMRSVVQLQPGERRSCIGCHDERPSAPPRHSASAMTRPAQSLEPPPWGAEPFGYERVVQPVLDRNCVRCHNGAEGTKLDLRAARDGFRVPASYRSLIEGGWVHHFDWTYGARHFKADPLSFGTLKSRLFEALAGKPHKDVKLSADDLRAIKAWIDLNCPLWPDYRVLPTRPE